MTIDVPFSVAAMTDGELLAHVQRCATTERGATARLIAALAEVDARRLYPGQGYSSLFTYCTQALHLSEHAAYARIEAARAARKFPVVLDLLADGSLHLTAVTLLAPHLTADNHAAVLASGRHKSKRDVELLVAALRPQPPAPSSVRQLPSPAASSLPVSRPPMIDARTLTEASLYSEHAPLPAAHPKRIAEVKPLAPASYKVQFTASQETYDRLRLAQDLLRHTIQSGDVAEVIGRALTVLVEQLQRGKCAAVDRPRPHRPNPTRSRNRHIPAAVKREVWRRDGGRCAFVGAAGRCTERGRLEYHHRIPFADGGPATVENLELRCRAHNAYEAEQWFGAGLVRETPPPFVAANA